MTDTSGLIIRTVVNKGRAVFTVRNWNIGDIVVSACVVAICPTRTIHSFQTGPERHCDFDEPARLLNHSCCPNLGIRDNIYGAFDFIALRPIPVGAELTWNYATSEFESIAVPDCRCGATTCRGNVRGYKYLTPDERTELPYTADYLHVYTASASDFAGP